MQKPMFHPSEVTVEILNDGIGSGGKRQDGILPEPLYYVSVQSSRNPFI